MDHAKKGSQKLADPPAPKPAPLQIRWGSLKVEFGYSDEGGHEGIEASGLIEAYAGVLLGVLALGGLVLQFWQIREQQKEFRHTLEINMYEQQLDRLRRSFDTILPDGMKKGYRTKAQAYQWLLDAYAKKCQSTSEDIDRGFIREAQGLIASMHTNEKKLEALQLRH